MKKTILLIGCMCFCLLTFCHFRTINLPNELNEKVVFLLKEYYRTKEIDFVAVSYDLFDVKIKNEELILFGKFCILSYDLDKNIEYPETGYHDFMALNIHKDNNNYILKDVWMPNDSSGYLTSILKKFPFLSWSKVLFDNKFSNTLYKECCDQFHEYITE